MSENAERNGQSVRPNRRTKQKFRKEKKSENDESNCDVESKLNNKLTDLNNDTVPIPFMQIPRVSLSQNNSKQFYEERKEAEITSRVAKIENIQWIGAESGYCTYDSQAYTTPQIINARLILIPLLSCNWCLRLFNVERNPRCYERGVSVCMKCIPYTKKAICPFNFHYVHHIHNLMKNLKFFNSDTPAYSELQRGLFNKRNYSNVSRLIKEDLNQRLAHLKDIYEHYKDFETKNQIRSIIIAAAIGEIDDFRKTFQSQDIIEWLKRCGKCSSDLKRFWQLAIVEEFGKEADWLFWSKRVHLEPSMIVTRVNLQKLGSFGFEYYAVIQRIDGVNCYSKLYAVDNGFFISAFTPMFPTISTFGLTSFIKFDPYLLQKVTRIYFEIPVGDEIANGLPLRSYRYEVFLGYPRSSWHYAYMFLGFGHQSFLGAEIEVTHDEVIFSYYLYDGKPVAEKARASCMVDLYEVPLKGEQSMVVSNIKGRPNKLTIFKYDKPENIVASHFGHVGKSSVGSLLKIPLGMHRITACGICCDL